MKLPWRFIALGVVAYLIFLLATLPADRVLSRMQTRGVIASGVTGSIWSGKSGAVQIGRLALGEVEWSVSPWRLFAGKVSVDLHAKRNDGSLQATIAIGLGKRVVVRELRGAQPIAALGGLGLPGGWDGILQLNITELDLENNWPVNLRGAVDARNLSGPASQPTQIGSFRVEFSEQKSAGEISGVLTSAGDGPFDVTGTLRLLPNRNYVVDANVALRPGAPTTLSGSLQYLGPPDAQGRRALSMSGTL